MAFFAPRHHSYAHQKWAKAIKKRAKGKCEVTKKVCRGQAHHLYSADDYPDKMHDLDNGVYIMEWIHRMFHIDFMGGYDVPCTKKDWERFLKMFNKMKKRFG